jgi:flagellar basal-body rod modification protein FlgD
VTVTAITPATAQPAAAPKTDAALIDSDFETFLKMLTTQMKNQDPLDPIDNSDYAVQLATFSGVEQQVKTNDLLGSLGTQFGVMSMSELAGWVGKEGRAAMPVTFDGTPVTLWTTPDSRADTAELVVKSSTGAVVSRTAVDPATETLTWDGKDATGALLPSGTYTLSVESFAAGASLGSAPVESYAKVQEARLDNGTVRLVFPGGVEVAADKVTGLRAG